jgi:hypothetical protein
MPPPQPDSRRSHPPDRCAKKNARDVVPAGQRDNPQPPEEATRQRAGQHLVGRTLLDEDRRLRAHANVCLSRMRLRDLTAEGRAGRPQEQSGRALLHRPGKPPSLILGPSM